MTVAEAFERAIGRLIEKFAVTYDEALWTERDAEYRLGSMLEDELRNARIRLRVRPGQELRCVVSKGLRQAEAPETAQSGERHPLRVH